LSNANDNGPPTWQEQLHDQTYGGTEEPPPEGGEGEIPVSFDPADHTIDEVKAYVDANPDQRTQVLSDEKQGKQRSTLIDWLVGG